MNHKVHGGNQGTKKCPKCNLVVRESLLAAHEAYRHHHWAIAAGECNSCRVN